MALARALYGDPFLIVLDEPNSNLDTEGDEALTRAVRGARERGAIVVVVAHRPIGIEAVDQVLVLKDGRMQAFGPKETGAGAGAAAARRRTVADQDRLRGGSQIVKQLASQLMIGTGLKGARRSIQVHLIIGLVGGRACSPAASAAGPSTAEISGALIAPGQIVVESNVKKVQHPTGGVVGEVRARDGDLVKAGDIVVRLDDTVTKANLAIVTKNLDAATARAARLEAEQRGLDHINVPDAAHSTATSDPDVSNLMASEMQVVRGPRQRPRRAEGAIARARHPAERGNRRPRRAGEGQGPGNRAGREGAGRRARALRPAPGADYRA